MTVDQAALRAVAELHHRYLTGVILALVHRQGTARTAEIVRRTFRRQHLEKFLPGLDKLELRGLPDAVACAQYHYLSNALGGVKVEWIAESDTKSWVRYLPPRWIWDGVAVCAVPTEVNRAMLWGWHAHNGVTLGNDRLGFVATSLTTDGGAGLVGYYVEEDRPLAPEERLRFSPGEVPPGPAGELPTVSWDAERLAKVERNYAMDYVRSLLPELCAVLGPADAAAVGRLAGRQIGMQYHDVVIELLDMADAAARRRARALGGGDGGGRHRGRRRGLGRVMAAGGRRDVASCRVRGVERSVGGLRRAARRPTRCRARGASRRHRLRVAAVRVVAGAIRAGIVPASGTDPARRRIPPRRRGVRRSCEPSSVSPSRRAAGCPAWRRCTRRPRT